MKTFELFYEMKHTPFTRGIPTSVLYKTHQSSEVFSRLEYTAKNQLFAVLIGEPGTGKTSTLCRLKDELPEGIHGAVHLGFKADTAQLLQLSADTARLQI